MKKYLKIYNRIDELDKVVEFIEELGEELQLSTSLVVSINLALEEAISNVILYAYPNKDKVNEIHLTAEKEGNDLILLLADEGVVFDPTLIPEADITLPLEERPIGGLGIFLIRQIMEEISWQRIDGENQLTMKKKIVK